MSTPVSRSVIVIAALLTATACAPQPAPDPVQSEFIRVEGRHFVRDGKPYHFLGANLWYGANLAAIAEGGDRDRLIRELDLLQSLGIDNLRVLAASEGLGQDNTVWPPFQPEPGLIDERLLDGLDFLLAEMAERDMVAVIYLNNYWVWSGGMAQYVSWFDGDPLPNPFLEDYSWDEFMAFSARFYTHDAANETYRRHIERLINRTNTHTGVKYRDDPTIMSWQLGNEPRPGRGEAGIANFGVFTEWVGSTAAYIRSLDPNHLISTGNEGLKGSIESGDLVLDIHRFKEIDYMTVHLWILNWSWYDPLDAEATYPEAERQAVEYLDQHIAFAEQLGKPLVLEEFGIPRDLHSYSPEAATSWRDRFLDRVFDHIHHNAAAGGVFAGSNFWTWGGFGEARDPIEAVWQRGDDFTGDPPQEPQGRNSIFAGDETTLEVLSKHARKLRAVDQR